MGGGEFWMIFLGASARVPAAAAAAAVVAASPGARSAGPGREASRRAWAVAVRS
jgi:hypothetical protein